MARCAEVYAAVSYRPDVEKRRQKPPKTPRDSATACDGAHKTARYADQNAGAPIVTVELGDTHQGVPAPDLGRLRHMDRLHCPFPPSDVSAP